MKLYPVFLLLFLTACHGSGQPHYYAHGGFWVPENYSRHGLNGRPVEIRDVYYKVKDMGAADSAGKFNNSEQWHFNKLGDIIYRQLFFTDSFWSESMVRYDDSGCVNSFVIHGDKAAKKQDTIVTSTVRVQPDGRFKSTGYDKNGHVTHFTFLSFSPDGNNQKEEFQDDPSNGAKISRTQFFFYEGERLLKATAQVTNGDSARTEYFYSPHNSLDSIVSFSNGTVTERTIFSNNGSGDPLRLVEVSPKGDTLSSYSYEYVYDKQGNWIKRWERQVVARTPKMSFYDPGYDITLTIRTIVYPKPITQ